MVQRKFILGSEWLYYKIYCGARMADIVLLSYLKPVLEELQAEKTICQWFFLRYSDPDNHLRLRLQVKDANALTKTIQEIQQALQNQVANTSIHKIETATYNRELERYGANTITIAEALFAIDSMYIVKALDLIADPELVLLFMLKNTDQLLTSFGLDTRAKRQFCQVQMRAYKQEFAVDKTVNKQLDQKYRKRRKAISAFVNDCLDATGSEDYSPLCRLLTVKQEAESPLIQTLMAKRQAAGEKPTAQLSSLIHMSVNRCFRSQQRLYELLIYDFLVRFYNSEIGKQGKL